MSVFRWYYSPVLLLGALCLPIENANAFKLAGLECEAGLNATPGASGIVTLDNVTPSNANTVNTIAQLNYKCTQSGLSSGYVSMCFGVDGGSYDPGIISPRYLSKGATSPTKPRLAFSMTPQGASLWGPLDSGNEYITTKIPIAGRNSSDGRNVIEGKIDINIRLSGSENTLATVGNYTNIFTNTTLKYDGDTLEGLANCSSSILPGRNAFPFTVQTTVIEDCKISTTVGDIDLGSKPATERNIAGETVIGVTCTNNAPYNIGLSPSNNNLDGSGVMTSKNSNNTDKVPYQLRSKPGPNGTVWGNRTTVTDTGNGVAGKGTGTSQTNAVYVTVPSADYKPDEYSDTVTINVHY